MREIKFKFYCEDSDTLSRAFTIEELVNGTYDWHGDIHKSVKNQCTGLKDKNGLTEIYESDIINENGLVVGNIYEMDKRETDTVIQGFGSKTWCETVSRAILLGCRYSE